MNILRRILNKCICISNIVNAMTMVLIFFCTVLLLGYYYPANANLYICFPFALFTLFTLYRLRGKYRLPILSDKGFIVCVIGITMCAEILYVLTEIYYPLRYTSDHLIVKETAIYLAGHSSFPLEYEYYFHMFPNNLSITILSGFIYKVFGTWKAVEIAGSLLVNLSVLIAGLTVKNTTGSKISAIVGLLLGHFYIGLCFHSFIPYTHNFGILFPVLCLYLYTCNLSCPTKIALIVAVASIGNEMKVTTLIPFIAIAFYGIIDFLRKPRFKIAVIAIFSVIICFGGCKIIRSEIYKNIGYQYDETIATTMPFFLMMGQCTETIGQCDYSSYLLNEKLTGHPQPERDSIFTTIALQRCADRGFMGNLKFFGNKICMSWGDGTMSAYKTKYHNPQMQKLSVWYSFPRQYILYLLLILMLLTPYVVSDVRIYPFMLSITGVFAYQFLFESQSRYIYMYTPIIIVISVTTLFYLLRKLGIHSLME